MLVFKGNSGYDVIEQIRTIPMLSSWEIDKLLKEAHLGNEKSLNTLIYHSLRLISYCITVHFRYTLSDYDKYMELFQEGVIILRGAILKYDWRCSFSTFCMVQLWGGLRNNFRTKRDRGTKDASISFIPIDEVEIAVSYNIIDWYNARAELSKYYKCSLTERESDLLTHLIRGYSQTEWAHLKGISRQRGSQIYLKLIEKISKKRHTFFRCFSNI